MSNRRRIETKAARAFALKRYGRALEHLDELLEVVGENPQTLYMIALCHARREEDATALRFARRALAADPTHLDCLKLLARLHFLRAEHDEARAFAARAIAALEATAATPHPPPRRHLVRRLRSILGRGAVPGHLRGGPTPEDREWLEWAQAYLASADEDAGAGE